MAAKDVNMVLVERYLSYRSATGKSLSTITTSRRVLKGVLSTLQDEYGVRIEDSVVSGLDGGVLYDWYASLDARGCSMSTKNLYVIILNQFLHWLYTLNSPSNGKIVITDDLSGLLKCGKIMKQSDLPPEMQKKRDYSSEQITSLLTDCTGTNKDRDRAIIALMSGTGMRCIEVCSLNLGQWERMESDKSVLVKRKGGKWSVIEVPEFVLPYMRTYIRKRMEMNELSPDSPLFLSTHGCRMTQSVLYRSIGRKQKQVGMDAGLHNFRHTVLSNMPTASVARDVAGHTSFAVTTAYSHTSRQQRAQAVNNLPWAKALMGEKE